MAAGKELRTKIKSVENTKKITKAMEMISVSKMRKAQERMRAARPYADEDPRYCHKLGQGQSGVRAQFHEDRTTASLSG